MHIFPDPGKRIVNKGEQRRAARLFPFVILRLPINFPESVDPGMGNFHNPSEDSFFFSR